MIKSKQYAKEMNSIIKETLINGNIPVYEEVIKKLQKNMDNISGDPSFVPEIVQPYSVSDPEKMTNLFTSLQNDIEVGFEENNEQAGRLLSLLNYYEIEKRKIIADLEEQNTQIDALKKYKSYMNTGSIVGNRISTFENIDFDGDEERNIPATTCMVDLRQQKAYNWRKRKKVDISDSSYSIKAISTSISTEELYPFNSCLFDVISDTWVTKVTSVDTTSSIKIIVELSNSIIANSIVYTFLSSRFTGINLYISSDGINFMQKADTVISNKVAEWNFDTQEIKAIQFIINKSEPDGIEGTNYLFYFGAENISVYNDTYSDNGIFTTKSMSIPKSKRLMLLANQIIYPKSSLRYYILFDNDLSSTVEWKEIEIVDEANIEGFMINTPNNSYEGNIRLVVVFHNFDRSPQLLNFRVICEGV